MSMNGRCPYCGYRFFWLIRRHHRKCMRCRKEWSPRTFYPIIGFRLTRNQWRTVIDTFLRDETGSAIEDECRLSGKTARACATLLRDCSRTFLPQKAECNKSIPIALSENTCGGIIFATFLVRNKSFDFTDSLRNLVAESRYYP